MGGSFLIKKSLGGGRGRGGRLALGDDGLALLGGVLVLDVFGLVVVRGQLSEPRGLNLCHLNQGPQEGGGSFVSSFFSERQVLTWKASTTTTGENRRHNQESATSDDGRTILIPRASSGGSGPGNLSPLCRVTITSPTSSKGGHTRGCRVFQIYRLSDGADVLLLREGEFVVDDDLWLDFQALEGRPAASFVTSLRGR